MRGKRGPGARAGARWWATRWWAAGLAGLASLALLGTGLTGTAQAAYPGANGRIAFVRGGNIYTIEPNGSGLSRLTSGRHSSGPRWSPNGKQIAYLYRGNLWIMDANGSDKTQITHAAPGYTDARPTWSPKGRYLAFVETERHHTYGYLTRYDTVTHKLADFTTEIYPPKQIKVAALPDAAAWAWAISASPTVSGSFILFEGAGILCPAHDYCLNALGWPHQYQYKNGYPSAEDFTTSPTRLLDPDWFPITPQFDTNVLTTQEHCSGGTCTHSGIDLGIGASPVVPGAYEAVYSPVGRQIAYVKKARGTPEVYLALNVASPTGTLLTAGSQPDWQPLAAGPSA
jgi:hypothetical protein